MSTKSRIRKVARIYFTEMERRSGFMFSGEHPLRLSTLLKMHEGSMQVATNRHPLGMAHADIGQQLLMEFASTHGITSKQLQEEAERMRSYAAAVEEMNDGNYEALEEWFERNPTEQPPP